MPKRSPVGIAEVADYSNLTHAFWRAARGHRDRREVVRFAADLERELTRLGDDLRDGRVPEGRWTALRVYDPKPRDILAPCFRDRVLHHALMAKMGPLIERSLVDDTWACRVGRGTHGAVRRAQQHLWRFPWCVKGDMRAYFASVDHGVLRAILRRRFKHPALLACCDAILASAPGTPGRGLPIGALTSQWFANLYLDGFDRYLLEQLRVQGMVRYMDDVLWWCPSRDAAQETLSAARAWLQRERGLELKPDARVVPAAQGVAFLGFRVRRGCLRLSARRMQRYRDARARWERRYARGELSDRALQAGYAAALAVTHGADARGWRRAQLRCRPTLDV